ncbi:MAG: hypothetical protein J0H38_06430 [Rhizobiales bacterium]|nr:hypothetical protein [Hyphomicrobiales bacterium]
MITSETAASATQVKLAGTATAGLVVDIYDQGTLLGSVKASSTGTWTFTTSSLANGDHVFTARATDAYTNSSASSAAVSVTVTASGQTTTPAPAVPTIASFSDDSGVAGDHITNDNTLTLSGAAAANSTVKIYDGAKQVGTATANSSGAWSFTTAALADGAHSFTTTATAGSTTSAASAALAVTIDTAAPTAPVIASSAPTGTNAFLLKGTAEANSVVKVFDGTTQIGTATADSKGAWTYTTSSLSSGSHSFTAKAMDVAGNTGVASTAVAATVSAPAAPSAPTIVSFSNDSGVAGDGITNDNTVTLTGKAAANSTIKVFDGAKQIGTATADANGAWSFTSAALTDGNHSLTATATSGSLTSSASTALSLVIDTVAPVAPTVTMSTSASTLASTKVAQLTGTAEANSTVTVFDGTTKIGTVTANSSGAWTFTTATLATGSHSFTAKAMDAAGNTGVASAALGVTVSASTPSAPSAPAIVSFSNDSGVVGDGITNDNTLTLTGTAAANSTVKVYDGATQIGTTTANASGSWSYITSVLTDAKHVLTATATNSTGQTSSSSATVAVTIDTKAPDAPTIDGSTAGAVQALAARSTSSTSTTARSNVVNLTGTAEAKSTIDIFDGGKKIGSVTAAADGSWNFTTDALTVGHHTFTAKATDVAGNAGKTSTVLDIDITAPTPTPSKAPSIVSFSNDTGKAGDNITSDSTLTLKGTGDANSTIKVFDGSKSLGTVKTDANGAWTYTTAVLADGAHNLTAKAVDASGKLGTSSAALAVTIDTHAPNAPTLGIYSSDGKALGGSTTVDDFLLKGTAEANSIVKVFDAGKQIGSVTTKSDGTWSYDTGHVADGSHNFTATATDIAGNASATSSGKGISVIDAPTTTSSAGLTDVFSGWFNSVVIKGTSDAYSQVKIYDSGKSIGTVTADSDGAWTFASSSGLSNALHTFTAKQVDQAGHESALSGSAIVGTLGKNTLVGTSGDDIFIGRGHPDTFVFAPNFGNDVINDFRASGWGHDVVQFSKSIFDNFADVLAHATQSGQDVVISAGHHDSLTLKNTKLAALDKSDFHFV